MCFNGIDQIIITKNICFIDWQRNVEERLQHKATNLIKFDLTQSVLHVQLVSFLKRRKNTSRDDSHRSLSGLHSGSSVSAQPANQNHKNPPNITPTRPNANISSGSGTDSFRPTSQSHLRTNGGGDIGETRFFYHAKFLLGRHHSPFAGLLAPTRNDVQQVTARENAHSSSSFFVVWRIVNASATHELSSSLSRYRYQSKNGGLFSASVEYKCWVIV